MRHHPHRHRPHPPGLHHLNSVFLETLTEHSMRTMGDLVKLADTHHPALTPAVHLIIAEGITDPALAVQLLQIDEAIATLGAQRVLLKMAAVGGVATVVPLPPHVTDRLLPVTSGPLFSTEEDHLPPHLAGYELISVERLMPAELAAQLVGVEAIVFEALVDGTRLRGRRGLARVLQTLSRPVRQFVHALPDSPHRTQLIDVGPASDVIFI